MQARTKKRPTEDVQFTGAPEKVRELRRFAASLGLREIDRATPWRDSFPEAAQNLPGTALKGARTKEGLTQAALGEAAGIPQRHVSEMENGKRPIGKETARKLAAVLHVDYRVFL